MKPFCEEMLSLERILKLVHRPNKNNLLNVLRNKRPDRTPLYDLFLNDGLYERVTADLYYAPDTPYLRQKRIIDAYYRLGYDNVNLYGASVRFPVNRAKRAGARSVSMNEQSIITDWGTFEQYQWPDVGNADYERIDVIGRYLPDGMGYVVYGPGGIQEVLIELVGYERLCYMLIDEPELVQAVVDRIGECIYRYYEICASEAYVDALVYNDDWGFNTQTLLPPYHLRNLIFPWVRRIVDVIHMNGKPAILHSCGNLSQVMDDIIDELHFDAKHSFQDNICPVEKFYRIYGDHVAVLGGIDVDFIIRAKPCEVYRRACELLALTGTRGRYALGTGNSVPEYVPDAQYLAMIAASLYNR